MERGRQNSFISTRGSFNIFQPAVFIIGSNKLTVFSAHDHHTFSSPITRIVKLFGTKPNNRCSKDRDPGDDNRTFIARLQSHVPIKTSGVGFETIFFQRYNRGKPLKQIHSSNDSETTLQKSRGTYIQPILYTVRERHTIS
jgi:hypothetical protein